MKPVTVGIKTFAILFPATAIPSLISQCKFKVKPRRKLLTKSNYFYAWQTFGTYPILVSGTHNVLYLWFAMIIIVYLLVSQAVNANTGRAGKVVQAPAQYVRTADEPQD